jgi:hypothetical protein
MRAFRPSEYGRHDEADEENDRVRLDNVQRYAQRAQAGLPLFELVQQMSDRKAHPVKHLR